MEGYFPVAQYCEMTGISKDTAHHRAIRGTVESFKNKYGRWFLYFCDETKPIPEGYIHLNDYAKAHNKTPKAVYSMVRKNRFLENEVHYHTWMTTGGAHRTTPYILETAEYPGDRIRENYFGTKRIMIENRPDGYITVSEFCKREDCGTYYVYNRINAGKIRDVKMIGGHWYVPETLTIKEVYKYGHKNRGERGKGGLASC